MLGRTVRPCLSCRSARRSPGDRQRRRGSLNLHLGMPSMSESALKPGLVLTGPLFNEPMRVETVRPGGNGAWIAGLVGLQSERFRNVTLTPADLKLLHIQD